MDKKEVQVDVHHANEDVEKPVYLLNTTNNPHFELNVSPIPSISSPLVDPSREDVFETTFSQVSNPAEQKINLKASILYELTSIFNKRVDEYFRNNFENHVETIVERKINDMLNRSSHNASILDLTTTKTDLEERLIRLEECKTVHPNTEKILTKIETFEEVLKIKKNQLEKLEFEINAQKLKTVQLVENVHCLQEKTNSQVTQLNKRVDQSNAKIENGEQYSRKETLEFHGIPNGGTREKPENCYEVVSDFCWDYFNIDVRTYDMSIAHRQYNPEEKRQQGRGYIPSIYVRFVNRFLADKIYKKKGSLKNFRNCSGGKFYIKWNLTIERRQLWEDTLAKLPDFTFKWIKNGEIFVKKSRYDRMIRIKNDDVLQKISQGEKGHGVPSANVPPQTATRSSEAETAGVQSSTAKLPSSSSRFPKSFPALSYAHPSPPNPPYRERPLFPQQRNIHSNPPYRIEPRLSHYRFDMPYAHAANQNHCQMSSYHPNTLGKPNIYNRSGVFNVSTLPLIPRFPGNNLLE